MFIKCFWKEPIQGINLNQRNQQHTHAIPQCTLQSKASSLNQASSLSPHLLFSPLSFSFFPSLCPSLHVSLEAVTAQSGSQRRTGASTLCLPLLPLRSKSPFIPSCLFFLSTECALACLIKLKRLDWDVALCCTVHNSLFLPLCPLYS